MKSAQTMLTAGPISRSARGFALGLRVLAVVSVGIAAIGLCGCQSAPELTPARGLVAPYDTSQGQVLWAVVPLRNESGTTTADPLKITDAVVAAIQKTEGIRCLPLNRTIEVMRTLGGPIAGPEDAKRLAALLGVDGLVMGSITAYDPYDPPTLGLSLALYARPGAMEKTGRAAVSPRQLEWAYAERAGFDRSNFVGSPLAVASELLDARDHRVLLDVKRYAEGRSDPTGARHWRIYTASMDLYTQFAAHHTVGRLLEDEWLRLARATRADASR